MSDRVESEPARNWYILLWGVRRPNAELVLAPGVTLRPILEPLTIFDLAAAGAAGFREWAVLDVMSAGCTCEIETAWDAALPAGYNTLNRAWLTISLLVLRGCTTVLGVACSSYSWNQVAGYQKRQSPTFQRQLRLEGVDAAVFNPDGALPRFEGTALDFHLKILTDSSPREDPIGRDDAEWVRTRFDTTNRLAYESDSFRLGLEAAADWRFAKEPRVAIARIWSGIEAILGVSTELVYRISLICASLLTERGPSRKERFGAIKKLYGLRSKAVHGESMSGQTLQEVMIESFVLLKQLLVLAIDRGHVLSEADFDEAVFG